MPKPMQPWTSAATVAIAVARTSVPVERCSRYTAAAENGARRT